jgi:hypothetical protein
LIQFLWNQQILFSFRHDWSKLQFIKLYYYVARSPTDRIKQHNKKYESAKWGNASLSTIKIAYFMLFCFPKKQHTLRASKKRCCYNFYFMMANITVCMREIHIHFMYLKFINLACERANEWVCVWVNNSLTFSLAIDVITEMSLWHVQCNNIKFLFTAFYCFNFYFLLYFFFIIYFVFIAYVWICRTLAH